MAGNEEILMTVLDYWFAGDAEANYSNKWFTENGSPQQAAVDTYVREHFGGLLTDAEAGRLDGWARTPCGAVALVLVLDQFSRHAYRADATLADRIAANTQRALAISVEVIGRGWDCHVPIPHAIFLLMPFRHCATLERLRYVMSRAERLGELAQFTTGLVEKFRRATLRRLQHLEGKDWKEGDEILEHHAFEADTSDVPKNALYVAMQGFLEAQRAQDHRFLAVSLSGGVDSMVIMHLLLQLCAKFNDFKIVAIHIDYGNRPESVAEADYVEKWCNDVGKGSVVFRKRRIDEVRRGVTDREQYEKIARDIRFGFYQQCLAEFGCPAVFFGHHQGDVQENVLSNMMKRSQLLDISGMGSVGVVNNVTIWRPLIDFLKADIFAYSHKYGVPYFKDTTPKWSSRGTMRNQLMPLLQEMYGAGYLHNLSHLAQQSSELSELLNEKMFSPLYQAITSSPVASWVDLLPYAEMPLFFWREAFKHVCHSMWGISLISDGPLRNQLMERLNQHRSGNSWRDGFVELKKGQRFFMQGTLLIYFRPSFFSAKPQHGTAVELGVPLIVGNWKVVAVAEIVHDAPDSEPGRSLALPDVLGGEFEYRILNTINLETVRLQVDNHRRPKAVRAVPKVITDALPLVNWSADPKPPFSGWIRVTVSTVAAVKGAGSDATAHS